MRIKVPRSNPTPAPLVESGNIDLKDLNLILGAWEGWWQWLHCPPIAQMQHIQMRRGYYLKGQRTETPCPSRHSDKTQYFSCNHFTDLHQPKLKLSNLDQNWAKSKPLLFKISKISNCSLRLHSALSEEEDVMHWEVQEEFDQLSGNRSLAPLLASQPSPQNPFQNASKQTKYFL